MAKQDIQFLYDGAHGDIQARRFAVAAGARVLNPGELVLKTLGSPYVTNWAFSIATKPSGGTDFIVGVAVSTSTETATADGTVDVAPLMPGHVLLANPNVAATWDTQSEYDALVGDRVLLNISATGVQTILASDHASTNGGGSGLVIEPLDVLNHPGKVAFSVRNICNYLA